nr:hypothetical protein [Paracoccus homiensis]
MPITRGALTGGLIAMRTLRKKVSSGIATMDEITSQSRRLQ